MPHIQFKSFLELIFQEKLLLFSTYSEDDEISSYLLDTSQSIQTESNDLMAQKYETLIFY